MKNAQPEIAFKSVKIEGLAIFMERDATEVSIDEIIDLENILGKPDFEEEREKRIYAHIRRIFDDANVMNHLKPQPPIHQRNNSGYFFNRMENT